MIEREEKDIQEKHRLLEEMLGFVSEYRKKSKIKIWYNIEDFYALEEETTIPELIKIKEDILNQFMSIPNCDYGDSKPKYKLELKRDDKGKIISYDLVEDLPECYSWENELPLKRRNDLIRFLPEEDELILPTREEMRNEHYENEWKKLQVTTGLQEDMEEF